MGRLAAGGHAQSQFHGKPHHHKEKYQPDYISDHLTDHLPLFQLLIHKINAYVFSSLVA